MELGEKVIVTNPNVSKYLCVGTCEGKDREHVVVRFGETGAPVRHLSIEYVRAIHDFKGCDGRLTGLIARNARGFGDLDLQLHSRNHLILTGPNGSGKSSLLTAIREALADTPIENTTAPPCKLTYDRPLHEVVAANALAPRLLVYIPPALRWNPPDIDGPKEIHWGELSGLDSVSNLWMQHLTNTRTALSFAREDGADEEAAVLAAWLEDVEAKLAELFGRADLKMVYDRKKFRYTFEFGTTSIDLAHLPDGFASLLSIWAEILLREKAWEEVHGFKPPVGFVLIDELESHLHLQLQESVLGLLTTWYPNFQFIVTTHAATILSSIEDAWVVDLGSKQQGPSSEFLGIPYGDLMTGHFQISSTIDLATTALRNQFFEACEARDLDEAKRLGEILSSRSATLSLEVWKALKRLNG